MGFLRETLPFITVILAFIHETGHNFGADVRISHYYGYRRDKGALRKLGHHQLGYSLAKNDTGPGVHHMYLMTSLGSAPLSHKTDSIIK